jgi:competence protein ComEA
MTGSNVRCYDFRWRPPNVAALTVLSFLAAMALAGSAGWGRVWMASHPPSDAGRLAAVEEKINPNVATVGSLRRLPGIGPVKAQTIAEFRASRPGRAFARAEDLDKVEGLGPAAVERLKPYLEFAGGS